MSLRIGSLIGGRKVLTGSDIGGIAETQEMLDFCGQHGIVADVEMVRIQDVNTAWERLLKADVKFRFVIDMATLIAGPGAARHLADFGADVIKVERPGGGDLFRQAAAPFAFWAVDPETGIVTIDRYTAVQDVGTAIHPSYVEGQIQGGAAQGIGIELTDVARVEPAVGRERLVGLLGVVQVAAEDVGATADDLAVLCDAYTAKPSIVGWAGNSGQVPNLPYFGSNVYGSVSGRSPFACFATSVSTGAMPATFPTSTRGDICPQITVRKA